jgi:hypothetical protein
MHEQREFLRFGGGILLSLFLLCVALEGCAKVTIGACPPGGAMGSEKPGGCGMFQTAAGQPSVNGENCTSGKVCPNPETSYCMTGTCHNFDQGGGNCTCTCF